MTNFSFSPLRLRFSVTFVVFNIPGGIARPIRAFLLFGVFMVPGLFAQIDVPEIRVAEGFEVERLYSISAAGQGSWVALAVDPRGRLIAGDQTGGLYRIVLSEDGVESVEPLDLEVGHLNGLLYAFDSLYAVVAEDKYQGGGLYRIRDTNGDDVFDEVRLLRRMVGQGEHGPHSVILGPEGKRLYVIAGNKTEPPVGEGVSSLVPRHWGEDDLLPRIWGPIGSERGTTAPGGWIARTDPEGESWELLAIGFRNAFDMAFNKTGDLFTTDADAEYDLSTPWYQPTRLLHVVNGTDYGWRSGSGKWEPYFADTLAPVYEYGPGSPTGIAFGYGTDFPKKYQNALFACDWSWGRIFVSWPEGKGGSYASHTEEFLRGIPLPVADLVVNPFDGAMYFTLGGRGTSSALYRIRYVGESLEKGDEVAGRQGDGEIERQGDEGTRGRGERKRLEGLIGLGTAEAVEGAWPFLGSEDRSLRHTARLVLEHAPVELWADRALTEADPVARLTALLGLARASEGRLVSDILNASLELDWQSFDAERWLLGLRCLEVAFIRSEESSELAKGAAARRVRATLENKYPANDSRLNAELLKVLVYLGSAKATAPAVAQLESSVTQEEKLGVMLLLRHQREGWTGSLRERFFAALGEAGSWSGGRSLSKYIETIISDSLETAPADEREAYRALAMAKPVKGDAPEARTRSFVKNWTLEELLPLERESNASRDLANGKQAFTDTACFACHHVNGQGGGIGPDLSAVMRRFSVRDLLEAVVEPSKVISDQYGVTTIQKKDGSQLHGKVVNYYGEHIGLQVNALDAAGILRVPREEIESITPSPVSPMPPGLLNTLSREDILDMLAYLKDASDRAAE